MSAVAESDSFPHSQSGAPVIVVGNGPVGIRFAREIHQRAPNVNLKIFGDEPWEPYNRIQLTSLISGSLPFDSLFQGNELPDSTVIQTCWHNRIQSIDPDSRTVIDAHGQTHSWSRLVLALGSTPRIPKITGNSLDNVFTFRNLADAQALMSRNISTRHTVILGGGLLGLEAARALQRFNTKVTILEHNASLMFYQLDKVASGILKQHVEQLGVNVITGARVKALKGQSRVEGIVFEDASELHCDTVVIAAGINPNIQLARAAGLNTDRGICVDEGLLTSQPDIYAIGECAQYKNTTYGLVGPGFEQASILADRLAGGDAHYVGSVLATRLKVLDLPVFSTGSVGVDESGLQSVDYSDSADTHIFRKLFLRNGRIVGAIAVGEWSEQRLVQDKIAKQERLLPWEKYSFRKKGSLRGWDQQPDISHWSGETIICNCNHISLSSILEARDKGASTIEDIAEQTGASTVCGSCKPDLQQIMGSRAVSPVRFYKPLAWLSLLALFGTLLTIVVPGNTWATSVTGEWSWDWLWRDSFYKQISGFTLLGVSVLISLISLRKRLKSFVWLDYMSWRLMHVLVGASVLMMLFAHTGFRTGANLNALLMFSFCGVLLTGAVMGMVISSEHVLPNALSKRLRNTMQWSHILLLWPLPALLLLHITKSYFF